MKQNRLKKIVLIAALSAALQPATSQCFSWGNLFAGCQSKVSGLLAAAQANKTKATLIVGGTSIVALALGTCLYKWFFSKKDETPIKKDEYKVVYKDENNGEEEENSEQPVSGNDKIPPVPPMDGIENKKPFASEPPTAETPEKNIIEKQKTVTSPNEITLDPKFQQRLKEQEKKNPVTEKPNPELEKKLEKIKEEKLEKNKIKKEKPGQKAQAKQNNKQTPINPLNIDLGSIINQNTVKNLKKTGNIENLNNKKTEPEYEKKQINFRDGLKKTNFVPTSQLGDSSTSELINKNKPTLPTNNIKTPK